MKVFLTGFMGAGKSSVGRILARRLDVPFRDLDDEVEAAAGRTIPEIFAASGEARFRQLEIETLARLLRPGGLEDVVVATGGGTMAQADGAALLRDAGTTVWLDVPFEVLVERLGEADRAGRPLFQDPAAARSLYDGRRGDYARADLTVEVGSGDTPDEVAARVEERLAEVGVVARPVVAEEGR